MGSKNPRVNAYIAKAAPFAKPILERIRTAVHTGCPVVEETMKWSFPQATYDAFRPSHRREYLEWIAEAKTTRDRRIATTIGWLAKGKSRSWKNERG